MRDEWHIFKEEIIGTKKFHPLKSSSDRSSLECIPSMAQNPEFSAAARLREWFPALCPISDPQTCRGKGYIFK